MSTNIDFQDLSPSFHKDLKDRSKTTDRIIYESEVEVIKGQIGDIEDIRFRLGLSARKMAQLLMVDPSAWSRWSKKITSPPPHIYRALHWYLLLQEKNPGFTPQMFLSHRWHSSQEVQKEEVQDLRKQIDLLKNKIAQINQPQTVSMTTSHNRFKIKSILLISLGGLLGFLLSRYFS